MAMTMAEARKLIARFNGASGSTWSVRSITTKEERVNVINKAGVVCSFTQAGLRETFGNDEHYNRETPFVPKIEQTNRDDYMLTVTLPMCDIHYRVTFDATWGIWFFDQEIDAQAFAQAGAWKLDAEDRLERAEHDRYRNAVAGVARRAYERTKNG